MPGGVVGFACPHPPTLRVTPLSTRSLSESLRIEGGENVTIYTDNTKSACCVMMCVRCFMSRYTGGSRTAPNTMRARIWQMSYHPCFYVYELSFSTILSFRPPWIQIDIRNPLPSFRMIRLLAESFAFAESFALLPPSPPRQRGEAGLGGGGVNTIRPYNIGDFCDARTEDSDLV